jgi:hypothetical protein
MAAYRPFSDCRRVPLQGAEINVSSHQVAGDLEGK